MDAAADPAAAWATTQTAAKKTEEKAPSKNQTMSVTIHGDATSSIIACYEGEEHGPDTSDHKEGGGQPVGNREQPAG